MSRNGQIALVAALAVLGVTLGRWDRSRSRDERSPAPARELESATPVAPEELADPGSPAPTVAAREADDASGAENAPSARPEPIPAASAPPPARAAVAAQTRRAISGVVVADGALPDEEIVVTASAYVGRRDTGFVACRARASRDGSFQLELPDDARFATLGLEAPSLVAVAEPRADAGASDVVLEARRLARITLRVALPPGARAPRGDPWRGVEALLGYPQRGNVGGRLDGVTRCVDGSIELARVQPGEGLLLGVENPYGPRWSERVEPLAPGEHREIRVELERGVSVSGLVLDPNDAPVEGARVRATVRGDPWGPSATRPVATTDARGAFAFAGLPPAQLVIVLEDSLGAVGTAWVDGREGDHADVILRLEPGACLGVDVTWPDGGTPHSGWASVTGPVRVSARVRQGRVELCELLPGQYSLDVSAWNGGRFGRAGVASISVAREPVELELVLDEVPLFTLRGTVVDPDGEPVDGFTVDCLEGAADGSPVATRGEALGSFVVADVPAGRTLLAVSAPGYGSQYRDVWVGPDAPPELRIVLSAPGVVRGRVVDETGAPARGAKVSDGGEAVACDHDGRFEVPVDAGASFLFATRPGSASSEPAQIEVPAGGEVEGVVLALREPCRVDGRVLDADGRPFPGATVTCRSSSFESPPATTDANGAFELRDLPPGEAWLHAQGGAARAAAVATLRPDATTHVELRSAPVDPVRIVGLVTRGGKPIPCEIEFYLNPYGAAANAGPDGRFAVELRVPGSGFVGVISQGADGSTETRVCEVDVPDVELHHLELEVERMHRQGGH